MQRTLTLLALGAILAGTAALASAGSVRVKMSELHGIGGVPPGWRFTLPAGDPVKGKEVFRTLECYACHIVEGQGFPEKATDKTGPQLTGMGGHHPAAYLAESILDPNAVILTDVPDWVGPDGRSTMPSYNDSLTLEQWMNLVAYLKSLTGGRPGGHTMHGMEGMHDMPGMAMGPDRDRTVGEYRVRLDYAEPEEENRPGYLAVAVADARTGQPMPYLPVRVRIGSGKTARSLALRPVITADGPRYGAAVLVPDDTDTVTVLIGAATVPVKSEERGRYRTPRQVSFEW